MKNLSVKTLLLGLAVSVVMPLAGAAETGEQSQVYVSQVFDRIKSNWSEQAAGKRLSNAQVTFLLSEDGSLSSSHVETGPSAGLSGQEALDFIKKSAPFGPFPEDWKGSHVEFRFRFTPRSLELVGYQVLEQPQVAAKESPVALAPGLLMMAVSQPAHALSRSGSQAHAQVEESLGMAAYVTDVQEKVKQKWQLPQDYVFQRVVADIMIDRDGSLLSAMLKQSSGDKTVDKAAMKAIQDAAPFNRVPASAKSLPVQIEYIFDPVQSPIVEQ